MIDVDRKLNTLNPVHFAQGEIADYPDYLKETLNAFIDDVIYNLENFKDDFSIKDLPYMFGDFTNMNTEEYDKKYYD